MFKHIKIITAVAIAGINLMACGDTKSKKDPKNQAKEINDSIKKANPSASVKSEDAEFLAKAGYAGVKEIKSSEAIKAVTKNADVIAFADMMVKEHTAMGDRIKAMANPSVKNVAIQKDLNEEDQDDVDDFKTDRDADKDYAAMMVKDHERVVKLFEQGDKTVTDADIKAFISDVLPKLRAHLDHAKELRDKLK